ncbi:hypothetical protein EBS80_00545 [bacterium]|nr:hypothetical protein [bacterium]
MGEQMGAGERSMGDLRDFARVEKAYSVTPSIEPMSGSNAGWAVFREPRLTAYDYSGSRARTTAGDEFMRSLEGLVGDQGPGYIICKMDDLGKVIDVLTKFPPEPFIDQP